MKYTGNLTPFKKCKNTIRFLKRNLYRTKTVHLNLPFPPSTRVKLSGGLVKILKLAHRHGDRMSLISKRLFAPGDMLLKRFKAALEKAGVAVFNGW